VVKKGYLEHIKTFTSFANQYEYLRNQLKKLITPIQYMITIRNGFADDVKDEGGRGELSIGDDPDPGHQGQRFLSKGRKDGPFDILEGQAEQYGR
jgi:hypothetical protein